MSSDNTFEKIKEQYFKLISDPLISEETLHKFFIKYPLLLPLYHPYDNIVFSKFPLGGRYVVDFAFAREDSLGVHWNFIEIEKPSYRQANKKGDPTKELAHGLRQACDWRQWFDQNRQFVANNFPFQKESTRIGIADSTSVLIIGRREFAINRSFLDPRLYVGINIMSFDRPSYSFNSPAVNLFEPLKVCKFVNGKAKVISELKISNSSSITLNSSLKG